MKQESPTPFFFAGELIAGSQLIRPLRVRELSECWLAFHRRNRTPIAIKFLRPEHPRIPQFYEMAEFLKTAPSPFLIRVFDCGETVSGLPYATMEYADGGTLRRQLTGHRRLPLATAVRLLREMLRGLAALHAHDMVHRDVKPDNIWLTSDGDFRLGDFGLVQLPGYPEERGKIFGTASCMSPEQAHDSTSVDARSDLYSLAVVLFEVLTGDRLRPKGSFAETLKFILSDRSAPPVDRLKVVATENLALLLGRMLEYSPALRPRSATEILAELDAMSLPGGV
ncbi:serine/threonine-protein kinase [uncultured Victivallis sp.]|mgnify:FL=1|uniref:serine/threonine-protein kinase n=1 Tax=uncultured Victivallis sp. TaxID=354118 RepID=UPI0025DE07C0|nr:serine/threonine-protein kinase [uncultured Victivallis sp.]